MIKNLTADEIKLLEEQIYSLKDKIIDMTKTKTVIDEKLLQVEYEFLYKNSKQLFEMILKDFSKKNELETTSKKFDKLIQILIKSLKDFNLNNVTNYQASKNYEENFREELWPENLRNKQ
jgi:hypothetical protein